MYRGTDIPLLGLHRSTPVLFVLHWLCSDAYSPFSFSSQHTGFQGQNIVAETVETTIGAQQYIYREYVTIVVKVNAAGFFTPPLLIFKGQGLQEASISNPGHADSGYCVTESSTMAGKAFLKCIKKVFASTSSRMGTTMASRHHGGSLATDLYDR